MELRSKNNNSVFIKPRYLNLKETSDNKGYSLLEVLISMVILLLVVVPLTSMIGSSADMNKGERILIASSILAQEAETLRLFPKEYSPVSKRKVKGEEWKIVKEVRGSGGMKRCSIKVKNRKEVYAQAVFRIYTEQ